MPFREKSAWIFIFASTAVGLWFASALMARDGLETAGLMLPVMIGFGILIMIMHIAGAAITPKQAGMNDDRDREIALKGEAAGAQIIGAFMLLITGLALFKGDWMIANIALIALLTSEFVKALRQIYLYRWSA